MTRLPIEEFAAFVGIDWADAKHHVCLQAAGSQKREFNVLEHQPDTIEAWVSTLRTRFKEQPIAIWLELNEGPLVALRTYDCLELFPVNPLTLARDREAFTPSYAKDDPSDAELQLELLLTHRDKLQPFSPQSPEMRALEQLVQHRRRLVGDKVRLTNRLTSTLKNYFPHVLQWFHDTDTVIFCDFLAQWPTLKAVQLARRSTLERFFRAHHVRYADIIDQRIRAIKSATPLTTDEGIIAPHALLVQALVTQPMLTEAYRLQGELLLRQATPDAAQVEACFHHALAGARRQQAKSWELRAAISLSRLWQQQGKWDEGRDLLAPIYGWFTEGFDTADLQEAKVLLEAFA